MEQEYEVQHKAKIFWKSQKEYPKYGTIKQRRLYEINYILPKVQHAQSLLDLGCGDGALIKCLHELTDISKYYAYDIATNLMKNIPAEIKEYDCLNPQPLPTTDVTVFAGVIPFLFEDIDVHNILEKIDSKLIYIKSPCSMSENIFVDTFSEKLQANYVSKYRNIQNMIDIISKHFKIQDVSRIYPDEIESEFGTKQMVFLCCK